MKNLIKKNIAVVGCGPVGLLGSLLMQHYNMDYVTVDKLSTPRTHPSAHYISANSKCILQQIPFLTQKINAIQQDWKHFLSYRYVEGIGGYQLGIKHHFQPNFHQKIKQIQDIFGQQPNHIPQYKLFQLLYEQIQQKDRLLFNQQIVKISEENDKKILINSRGEKVIAADYVIICNGINSALRNSFGFSVEGKNQISTAINIHFKSLHLASQIKTKNQEAMLHFVFGKDVIGILVNHSIERGQFVLQVPNYLPFVDLKEHYSGIDLIKMVMNPEIKHVVKDIQILNIGQWKIQGLLANKMHHKNVFLAGDSAHAYPPSGGFGMNSGFQDINDLIHTLKIVLNNENCSKQLIFERYCKNRREINKKYLQKSLSNYKLTLDIANQLGYPANLIEYFPKNSMANSLIAYIPSKFYENARLNVMKYLYKRKNIQPQLQLIFDEFDRQIQGKSVLWGQIANKGEKYDLWVKKTVSQQQVRQLCGEMKEENIFYHDLERAQRIVSSDGNVLLE